jgi:hypothetical protein
MERSIMNKESLERIMLGLNQYQLTKTEGQFVKSALGGIRSKPYTNRRKRRKIGKPLQGKVNTETQ